MEFDIDFGEKTPMVHEALGLNESNLPKIKEYLDKGIIEDSPGKMFKEILNNEELNDGEKIFFIHLTGQVAFQRNADKELIALAAKSLEETPSQNQMERFSAMVETLCVALNNRQEVLFCLENIKKRLLEGKVSKRAETATKDTWKGFFEELFGPRR